MDKSKRISDVMHTAAANALHNVAQELSRIIKLMSSELDPFPSFLSMTSIQAIELESTPGSEPAGCIVICPDGVLRQLNLIGIAGASGIADVEQVEQFEEVQLAPEEYLPYAIQAVDLLHVELQRRGK